MASYQDELSERAALWIKDRLVSVFDSLVEKLKERGFTASRSEPKPDSLALQFTKDSGMFGYTIGCRTMNPTPDWPKGRVALVSSLHTPNIDEVGPSPFRETDREYDIKDVGDGEIESHFWRTVRPLLSGR